MPQRPARSAHLPEVLDHGHKRLRREQHQDHRFLHPVLLSILPKDPEPSTGRQVSRCSAPARKTQAFWVNERTGIS